MPRTRVVILGWYGSGNTGDEAVLEGAVRALRERGIDDLHVLSTAPEATARALGVTSSPRALTPATIRALFGARALVLGGGGLIQDGTSVYNLPAYALFVALARLLGSRVICWGLGVEPIWTRLGKLLAGYIIRTSDHVSVRDTKSLRLLKAADVQVEKVQVTADLAFLLPIEPAGERQGSRQRVVFCMRELSDNHPGFNLHYLLPVSVRKRLGLGWTPPAQRRARLVQAAAAGAAWCWQELGASITLLPLWPGRDEKILGDLRDAAIALGVPADVLRIDEQARRPAQVWEVIRGADVVASMRLHALLFAASAGLPCLAFAYARKIRAQMRALRQERWVVEVDRRSPPPEEVVMKLHDLWEARAEVSSALIASARAAQATARSEAGQVARLIMSG